MTMDEWAKAEVDNVLKKIGKDEYTAGCYKSAYKAYKSLLEDEHSGFSWEVTKNILIRLMNNLPLTPITEDDFKGDFVLEGNYFSMQCSRMPSLFKKEENGKVTYSDVDRAVFVDSDGGAWGCREATELINELFPIKLPYFPHTEKFLVFGEDFLVDENEGDWDHRAFFRVKTPAGNFIELNKFYKYVGDERIEISKEEYYKDKENAINDI